MLHSFKNGRQRRLIRNIILQHIYWLHVDCQMGKFLQTRPVQKYQKFLIEIKKIREDISYQL